jgi:hypothetical protein
VQRIVRDENTAMRTFLSDARKKLMSSGEDAVALEIRGS